VKTWIAWGALAVAVIAVAARSGASDAPVRERRIEVPVRVEVPVEVPKIVERVRAETGSPEKESRAPAPAPVTDPRPIDGTTLAHEKMLFLFERELDLRAEQRRFMTEVLANRQLQIAGLQKGIVASGVFRPREYDAQVKAMQAASYEKMAEALNEPQRIRWKALIAEGRLGDAVQFEVPPTLVVLQD